MLQLADIDTFERMQLKLEQIYIFLHGVNLKRDLTGTENYVLQLAAEAAGGNGTAENETENTSESRFPTDQLPGDHE